ncbi:MAG TPA: CDP-diacylglycerol--glycerol-3-phosphate 3-phosphatidyltransferase [Micavibrio sp.]|jgi:CDP-diacylglycerol--glycerol-3-phosphate 3-phosphatidyltransferase
MLNIANILTLSRIILIAPLIWLMLHPAGWAMQAALGLYIGIAFTDWLDGFVARRFNQQSEFGRFLDPIADKILVAAMFIALCANGVINGLWLALPIVILTREFLVSGLREFLGPKNVTIHVSKLAKWKTATQMIALGFLIPAHRYIDAGIAGLALLLAAALLTVITGWDYIKSAKGYFK